MLSRDRFEQKDVERDEVGYEQPEEADFERDELEDKKLQYGRHHEKYSYDDFEGDDFAGYHFD